MPRQPPSSTVAARLRALLGAGAGADAGKTVADAGDDRPARNHKAEPDPAPEHRWQEDPTRGWVPPPPARPAQPAARPDALDALDALDELDGRDPAGPDPSGVEAVSRDGTGRHRAPPGPRLLTMPATLRGARVRVSWQAVAGLLVVLSGAVLVFAVRVARAEQAAAPETVRSPTPSPVAGRSTPSALPTGAGTGRAPGAGARSGQSPGATTAKIVMVHVAGQVARPGVVTLTEGDRVVDALALAGGSLPGADVQRINLARRVGDGEQLYVPRPGETVPAVPGGAGLAGSAGPGSGGAPGSAAPGSGAGPSGGMPVIDLNTADLAAFDGLPGIGPVLAQRIVDWRMQHGRFSSVDELGEVSGIGDKLLEQLRPRVTV